MTAHARISPFRRLFGHLENWKYTIGSAVDAGNQPYRLLAPSHVERRLEADRQKGLAERRVIFCANPGRSGSDFIASLMSGVKGCVSRHEPRPKMNGDILRQVVTGGLAKTYRSRLIKVLAINSNLVAQDQETVYFESNHMFGKTFADVVCDFYDTVDVVILRRHPVKVVRSFAELGYFTPRNPAWVGWMPDPVSTDPSLATLFPEADQLDRIMGYLASFEYTIDRLRATRPDVRFYELCLEDLATPDGASALVGALGLEWDPTLVRHIRKIRNARSDRKSYFDMDIPEQVCENRLASFYERLTRQGRDLPDLRERWERARETTAVKPDRGQG